MSKRLKRSSSDRMIAGICGGLADHFGWDPTIMRILFVVLLFTSIGTMLLIYLILIFVIPRDDRPV